MPLRRFWAAALLLLAGCTTSYAPDVGQPLPVATIPSRGEQLAEIAPYFPGVPEAVLRSSLGSSLSASRSFPLYRRNEWSSFFRVGSLVESINLVPDNPFAWVQLGAYLALNHHTDGAILATQRGLDLIAEKCPADTCPDAFRRLWATASINLANYLGDTERPLEGLAALETVDPAELSPFERIAYSWQSVIARSAAGDIEGARAALAAAEAEPPLPPDGAPSYSYRQYFGDERKAVEIYLAAVVADAAGEAEEAERKAKEAIERDDELWDAYLLLTSIQYERKDYDSAIRTLDALLQENPTEKDMFRLERIYFNLGNAYLGNLDLAHAEEQFTKAEELVRKRFERGRQQTWYSSVFELSRDRAARGTGNPSSSEVDEPAAATRFYLDALAATSPFYADACNNLGSVYEQRGDAAEKGSLTQRTEYAKAEAQWRQALRDQNWPRRHLAYGNLARIYVKTGRLSAAAEAADAALDLDPFNIVPLQALLDLSNTGAPRAVDAAQIAGWLLSQRREEYRPGILDELLLPYEEALRSLGSTEEIGRALVVLRYARAADDEVEALLRAAKKDFPEWNWPSIELARRDLAAGRDIEQARALVDRLAGKEVPLGDWLALREQGDVLLLRAALSLRDLGPIYGGVPETHLDVVERTYREARRDLERALAAGAGGRLVTELQSEVREKLAKGEAPPVSSLAVLPFDTIYAKEEEPIGHALAASLSTLLRGSRSALVRLLERDAQDVADWNPQTAVEVGRRSGVGAVISGRYAVSRNLVLMDVRVFDSASGEELFARAYDTPHAGLRDTQARIARDVLAALHVPPHTPPEDVAAKAFSARGSAYMSYLNGLDILLSNRATEDTPFFFESAVKEDAAFGRAYAALAQSWYGLASRYRAPEKLVPEAKKAADAAVKLAPDSAEAQLASAIERTWYAWSLREGKEAFDAALARDPCSARVHRLRGDFFAVAGDLDKAFAEKRKALELAPLSAVTRNDIGRVLFFQRKWDEALAQAGEALTLQPQLPDPYELKAWAYTMKEQYGDALDALDSAAARSAGRTPALAALRGVILARKGERTEAKRILGLLRSPALEARIHVALGENDAALEKLAKARDERSESIAWLRVDPWLDPLRGDSRFTALEDAVDRSDPTVRKDDSAPGPCSVGAGE